MTDAIFRTVSQALHVSFLMDILPVAQKSAMQSLIDRMLEEMGVLQVHERGTINFGGMSALEIRGQCAMIRGVVAHHLPKPEADSVYARYAHQACKAAGVRGVRDYVRPMLCTQSDMPTLAIAWSIYGTERQRADLSTRKIAAEFGLSPATVGRDANILRSTGKLLLDRAFERLTPLFESQAVIDSDESLQSA